LLYLAYRYLVARPASESPVPAVRSNRGFAFLSNGLLFCREAGGEVQQVHSPYAQEAMDRRERARERHGWKEGTSFGIAAGRGMRSFDPADKPLQATSAAYQRNGDLLYFLKDDNVGGLFRRESATGNELRVLLRQNFDLADLALSPDGAMLAASSRQSGGTAHITLLKTDGNGLRDVTGGDSVDTAPSWIPGVAERLLFQSAGLARDDQGYVVAQGHATIQKLEMDTGKVVPILDDRAFDHLKPRVCPRGNLHFIRRPYEASTYGTSTLLLDTLLFPFRLLRAVFHYLNFFSLMYSRKPLTSASGPIVKADLKNILLQGRRIDAEKAMRGARPVKGVASLVPDSWQLVRRDAQGAERVLATNVASYDIGADGTIIYTNGRGVFVLDDDGRQGLALADELVADVVAGHA
jgi:hypothetical protein